jgi:predicted permease
MSSIWSDVRLAVRGLRRSPLFAAVAIVSLAVGIGGNAAIFTLIDQILLRKLPVTRPEELVMLHQQGSHMGSNMGQRMHSYPLYQDIQQKAEPLSEVICRRIMPASVSVDNHTERVDAEMVSGNYFSMLGVKPALGRVFNSQEDDQTYQGHPVVVLSYAYWATRFARDPGVVGRTIRVNDYPMTIVGVSAQGFAGLDPVQSPQIRVPVQMKPVMAPDWGWAHMDDRRTRFVQVFGRLKPGYTVQSAAAPLQGLFTQVRTYEMTLPAAKDWSAYAREQFMKGKLLVTAADVGYSQTRNDFSTALVVLMCMVGLVLLIACANVANLLIARGFMRQKEIAVRLSIGASRRQLVRQLLVESLVLSFAGGSVGLGVAFSLTRMLLALVPTQGQPILINASPDLRILVFTLLVTIATGVVFGLLPALHGRTDPWTTIGTRWDRSPARADRWSCARAWSPRRSRSASFCSSAPASSSAACRTCGPPKPAWRSTTSSPSSSRRRSAATTANARPRSTGRSSNGSDRRPASSPRPWPACRFWPATNGTAR